MNSNHQQWEQATAMPMADEELEQPVYLLEGVMSAWKFIKYTMSSTEGIPFLRLHDSGVSGAKSSLFFCAVSSEVAEEQ